ncbi:MAG: redoxin domain-containing protein [Bacteroidota bacterium]|nr:redoxin domain-containing protein [Bacteroidota bacterium]
MKQSIFIIILITLAFPVFAQPESVIPPYKRFPTVPPFRLLLTDSSTIFTKDNLRKNKSVLVILFSPDCNHCQHETEEIIKHKDEFKKIQIVMSSTFSITAIKEFEEKYKLNELPNLIVGKDYQYILPPFFMIRNFPFIAMYNKKKQLISIF